MLRYAITNRTPMEIIQHNLNAGVEYLQIREKDLSARDLMTLVECVLALPNPHGTRVLVNSRLDVALAARAHGVHLPSGSIAPYRLREIVPADFLIGVSCHTLEEVQAAASEGANLVVFSPVFPPLSKGSDLAPHGLEGLGRAARAVALPVFALGGVTAANAPLCIAAGAAGVAGITLFREPVESRIGS